ncbi:anthranilate phosphoribosyltransferase [Neobacillus sedimentimangrovi]|jgi:anthranilate phosphoribosyltransferase|uniref:Anthranilate phosphoribosyltransferase n=1 Tax=Neobacillus sedimentimangrovi TaxID=2699460 RepID=A0ABS8QKA3_9BACI|nr:anthranilate phosphoribosyltransferase [Neobacillus sedimentimangrovi]AIM15303.1 anthranilate phosphoribosyltransferase [Bacillus sp. X1(2014)]MCD4838799.1 anthranilate phosphoribosyltransferase [Neobacillus sedimentimangrovi]
MKKFLLQLAEHQSFSESEMKEAVDYILGEDISESEIAAFLMGLKSKGETVEEIVGIVKAMKANTLTFKKKISNVLDNCGTGGDGSSSFNVSTTSAFVIAGAGIPVAKHGNRSVSSKTGSADVLEFLGVNLNLPAESIEEILHEIGIAFLFAPHVHPKLRKVMMVRRQLKIPTIFNFIGPLSNPIDLDYQLLGVYRRDLLHVFAEVLNQLGRKRAVVINGAGYMDEASLQGENRLTILENGRITDQIIYPEDVGLPQYDNSRIKGGDPKENADILVNVLKGKKGAYLDTVLFNAGIGIYTAGKAPTIQAGIQLARDIIDSGVAYEKLMALIEKTRSLQKEAM